MMVDDAERVMPEPLDVPRVGFSVVQAWAIVVTLVVICIAIAAAAIILALRSGDQASSINDLDDAVALIEAEEQARVERDCRGARRAVRAIRELALIDGTISGEDQLALDVIREAFTFPECRRE